MLETEEIDVATPLAFGQGEETVGGKKNRQPTCQRSLLCPLKGVTTNTLPLTGTVEFSPCTVTSQGAFSEINKQKPKEKTLFTDNLLCAWTFSYSLCVSRRGDLPGVRGGD